jgi:AcrR family transcriptional regulator
MVNVVIFQICDKSPIAGKGTMGIVERREREREEIRQKILDAARELFAAEGYDHVTMRRIADAIEYSPTTIYNHFEDKDDLVRSLCEADFARLLSFMQGTGPSSAPALVRQLGHAYARFAIEYPNHYRFLFMTQNKLERPEGEEGPGDAAYDLVRKAAALGLATGELVGRDADTMAQVLWASLHGVVALLITLKQVNWPAPPAPDLVDQVIENTIRGFLPRGH